MKVYKRTVSGRTGEGIENTTATISQREGMDEINDCMIGDLRKKVSRMSSIRNGTDYHIVYRDGSVVQLTLVDAEPEQAATTDEPMDWASTRTGNVEHRFDADGRALCSRRLRAYDRYVSQTDRRVRRTRSEIEAGEYAHLYTFCPKCSAL